MNPIKKRQIGKYLNPEETRMLTIIYTFNMFGNVIETRYYLAMYIPVVNKTFTKRISVMVFRILDGMNDNSYMKISEEFYNGFCVTFLNNVVSYRKALKQKEA